ncbi:lipase maturation factor 2-like [Ceratina calcarata]|uniref:Lipase maturation factor n=1 Tax=Ceratina calcarata TaxID=156304 RepID=A0AAJ7IWZ1_9HYME|nr:lipase maturation factor 2-like [Ceratina calcarata]XP_017878461.1 lipase maturation factor 2-like [Ceratina calcarata]XP_017878470.1 lipase maturation factor 2-like [Ceratina calcarata]
MVKVRYTRNLFLRGMCIIYLSAFLSFYIQIPGLYGENGILPARTQLDLKGRLPLLNKLKQKPTLLWFAPYFGLNVEYMLDVLSLIGVLFSFGGFISQKFCVSLVFALLWSLYYSLYQIGQTFMWYQWDVLLLEAGFLCILIAPFFHSKHGKVSSPTDKITFWTVRWLLFRLMFSSGVVKLTSGCPIWWKLDALSVHFESQCLPTSLAWYAHHLPTWFLRFVTVIVNVLELVIPFLFFFPNRKVKIIAFYMQVFLQVHIIATGNYNFFNFLTICLCISLLDDQFFYKKKARSDSTSNSTKFLSTITCIAVYAAIVFATYVYYNLRITDTWTIQCDIAFTQEQFNYVLSQAIPVSICIGIISLIILAIRAIVASLSTAKGIRNKTFGLLLTCIYTAAVCLIFGISIVPYATLHQSHNSTIPVQLKQMHGKVEHLQLVNSYGLFRRMTGVEGRPEVIIEGANSIDGPWKEYEFLYKPGNVNNSLPLVAPHQPRLDWQMWFAALGTYHQNPWLMSLAYRLLNGQPEVLVLLNNVENPFRDNPPKYIKASLYRYHYTSWSQSNKQAWWTREKIGDYFPIFSYDHPPLVEYLSKMKIIVEKPSFKVTNEPLKLLLDNLRSLSTKVEASLLLWGVLTAGFAIIFTSVNNSMSKKNSESRSKHA